MCGTSCWLNIRTKVSDLFVKAAIIVQNTSFWMEKQSIVLVMLNMWAETIWLYYLNNSKTFKKQEIKNLVEDSIKSCAVYCRRHLLVSEMPFSIFSPQPHDMMCDAGNRV